MVWILSHIVLEILEICMNIQRFGPVKWIYKLSKILSMTFRKSKFPYIEGKEWLRKYRLVCESKNHFLPMILGQACDPFFLLDKINNHIIEVSEIFGNLGWNWVVLCWNYCTFRSKNRCTWYYSNPNITIKSDFPCICLWHHTCIVQCGAKNPPRNS